MDTTAGSQGETTRELWGRLCLVARWQGQQMADCSLPAFWKTGPGSALSAYVPTVVTPSLFVMKTGQVTWSFMSIKTRYLVSPPLLHTRPQQLYSEPTPNS